MGSVDILDDHGRPTGQQKNRASVIRQYVNILAVFGIIQVMAGVLEVWLLVFAHRITLATLIAVIAILPLAAVYSLSQEKSRPFGYAIVWFNLIGLLALFINYIFIPSFSYVIPLPLPLFFILLPVVYVAYLTFRMRGHFLGSGPKPGRLPFNAWVNVGLLNLLFAPGCFGWLYITARMLEPKMIG